MLNYPISEKLLEKYIMLLLKNLEYTGDAGRRITIDTLKKFIDKVSIELIERYVIY